MNKNPGLKPGGERLEFVDSLRGFALFGVFYANLLLFSGIDYMTAEQRGSLFGGPLNAFAYYLRERIPGSAQHTKLLPPRTADASSIWNDFHPGGMNENSPTL